MRCFKPRLMLILLTFVSNLVDAQSIVFTTGSEWKFLDNGSNPSISWKNEGFDDSSWKTGNSQLGYGEGDEATIVDFGSNSNTKYITTYFRKVISIANTDVQSKWDIRIKRDDGIVLYINGSEVFRDNMPTGTISFNTLAPNSANDDGQTFINFSIPNSFFKGGNNTIAVEVHQNSGNSTDLSFDAELLRSNLQSTNLVSWFMSGAITSSSAVVTLKSKENCSSRLVVSESNQLTNPLYSRLAINHLSNSNNTVKHKITGLKENTRYFYGFEINGSIINEPSSIGAFKTVSEDKPYSFNFALASCGRTGSNSIVYDSIRAMNPEFFIITGDFFYGDIGTNDINLYRNQYEQIFTASNQKRLYQNIPLAYTWDDHDFGPNNSVASSPSKPAAIASYREIIPSYNLEDSEAIYQAFTIGRIRFILTDLRSQKVPQTSVMMGSKQLSWFKNELLKAKNEAKFIAWVSSVPYISSGGSDANDNWASYTQERKEIADHLQTNGIKNIFILSGDAHMLAIDNGSNSDYSSNKQGPYIPVFQAAALDQSGSYKGGPYSEGSFQGGGQFGIVEVKDSGTDNICIKFRGRNFNQKNDLITYSFCGNSVTGELTRPTSNKNKLVSPTLLRSNEQLNLIYKPTLKTRIEIIDVSGKVWLDNFIEVNESKDSISLPNLPTGMYHVLFKNEAECYSEKITVY